jgi:hypothetical protein
LGTPEGYRCRPPLSSTPDGGDLEAFTFPDRAIHAIIDGIIGLLKQGTSPSDLALTLAIGVVIGLFPVIGTTTALCTLAALAMRLNLVAIQAANYLVFPLYFATLPLFIRYGARIFGVTPPPFSVRAMSDAFRASWIGAVRSMASALARAVVAWIVAAPVLVAILYVAFLPAVRWAQAALKG